MIDLDKPVRRKTKGLYGRKPLVIGLEPRDMISVRILGSRTPELVSIFAVYDYAVKARVAREKELKKKGKQ